jgi:hypothetical protein
MEFSGSLKDFIAKAGSPQAIQFAKKGEVKDHLIELDLKSAYGSAMTRTKNFNGNPIEFKSKIPDNTLMFVAECILIKIDSETNPWIKKRYHIGEKYILDKIEYDYLIEKQGAEFEVIRGIEFSVLKTTFQWISKRIMKLSIESKGHRDIYKNILRLFHGILCERMKPKKYYVNSKDELEKILYKHEKLVMSYRKVPNSKVICVKVRRRMNSIYQNILLGVNIRSNARNKMYEILDKCHELGIEVYRCHTDSILIKQSDKSKLIEYIFDKPGFLIEKKNFQNGVKIIHLNKVILLKSIHLIYFS